MTATFSGLRGVDLKYRPNAGAGSATGLFGLYVAGTQVGARGPIRSIDMADGVVAPLYMGGVGQVAGQGDATNLYFQPIVEYMVSNFGFAGALRVARNIVLARRPDSSPAPVTGVAYAMVKWPATMTGAPSDVDFTAGANTVVRNAGSWITDGFSVGMVPKIVGTASNDGLASAILSVTATTLTFASGVVTELNVDGSTFTMQARSLNGRDCTSAVAGAGTVGAVVCLAHPSLDFLGTSRYFFGVELHDGCTTPILALGALEPGAPLELDANGKAVPLTAVVPAEVGRCIGRHSRATVGADWIQVGT
jgi:hypothetical protein